VKSAVPGALRVRVQIVFASGHTSESYVSRQVWHKASIERCPKCNRRIRRHGTYARKTSGGIRIARFYCRPCKLTVSLLPDFLAAGYCDTLVDNRRAIEATATSSTFDEAATKLRPDIELQGARRWLRRRVQRHALILAIAATALGLPQAALDVFSLRMNHPSLIAGLPTPVGLTHRPLATWTTTPAEQHSMGPDPP